MKTSYTSFSEVIYSLLDDPHERDMFYQKTLASDFDVKFDSSLQTLVRKLLLLLENVLPLPSLDQTSLWLGLAPSVLKECENILNEPEPLRNLFQHHKQNYIFTQENYVDDFIFQDLQTESALPLSSLRLLVSPLQLMSAALWGIVQHRAVKHYGLLEDFITAVQDNIPGALTYSERLNILIGLRAKVVLEMCNYDDLCYRENVEPHLKKMNDFIMEQTDKEGQSKMKASFAKFSKVIYSLLDDPHERDMFYQKTLTSEFDVNFDSSLETLTSLWLGLSSSVLKECEDILNQPEPLKNLIRHHKLNCIFAQGRNVDNLISPELQAECKATDSKMDEPRDFTVRTENVVPSVEVILSFDDEEDYNTSVLDPSDCSEENTIIQVYTHKTLLEHQKVCVSRYESEKQTTTKHSVSMKQAKSSDNFRRRKRPPSVLPPPARLSSAAHVRGSVGIVQHRAVKHYGLLEDFITAVQDNIPGALTYSERLNILIGLRAKVVLEMCNYDDLCNEKILSLI
ncbi:hypothetical protein WMY93_001299 [Mugilogobius chulae]|uniref:TERF1-interacting nuclear factor 2 N-terminal domain-containing protein n=1 Tax=Mugilogobius chulae TaxID=88201 RepID=A0AAW0Q1F4_9GOBI